MILHHYSSPTSQQAQLPAMATSTTCTDLTWTGWVWQDRLSSATKTWTDTRRWHASGSTKILESAVGRCCHLWMIWWLIWPLTMLEDQSRRTMLATGRSVLGKENPSKPSTSSWIISEFTLERSRLNAPGLAAARSLPDQKIWRFTNEYTQVNRFLSQLLSLALLYFWCAKCNALLCSDVWERKFWFNETQSTQLFLLFWCNLELGCFPSATF